MTCISPSVAVPANRRGFTLIEMLTVITIITILSAVSVAAIGTVKEGSKLTKCSANLMQISVGIHTYMNDRNGMIPSRSMILGIDTGFLNFLGFSQDAADRSYQKSTDSKCPKVWEYYRYYPGNTPSSPTLGSSVAANWDLNAMYNVNVNFPATMADSSGVASLSKLTKMSKIRVPSQCAFIFDGDAKWNTNGGVNPADGPQYMHSSLIAKKGGSTLSILRDGKTNVLFADGSVRALAETTSATSAYDETKYFLRTSASSNVTTINQKRFQLFWNYVGSDAAAQWTLP